jgi:hypothetical protein
VEKSNFMEVISQILRPKMKEISNFKGFFFLVSKFFKILMKTEFQILCSSSCFFLLFLWGVTYMMDVVGIGEPPPVSRELFFPIRTKNITSHWMVP